MSPPDRGRHHLGIRGRINLGTRGRHQIGIRGRHPSESARFVAVPFLVAGAPVITTMPARLARLFATELGLSLSPVPLRLPEPVAALVWHASYDHDPAHIWLRDTVARVAADVGWERLSA